MSWCKLQIHTVGGSLAVRIHVGVNQAIKQEKVYTQGPLKLTHIKFVILNSYVKFIFKIYQKHLFLAG